jgi:hypothetical protein
LDGLPVCARPIGLLSRGWLWCRRADRVRDAGTLAIFIGAVLTAWALYSTAYYTLLGRVERPAEAVWERLVLVAVFFVPMVWVGLLTLRRSLVALWAGLALSLTGLGFVAAFAMQERLGIGLQFGGSYATPSSRAPVVSLVGVLCGVMALAYGIALVAYRVHRDVMKSPHLKSLSFIRER